jgi:cytochrome c5
MKILVCAVLMLVLISNCTAEMPPIMAAEKSSRDEVAGRAKAYAATFKKIGNNNKVYDGYRCNGCHEDPTPHHPTIGRP